MNAHMEARIGDIEAIVEFHYADCDPAQYLIEVSDHLRVGVMLLDPGDVAACQLLHKVATSFGRLRQSALPHLQRMRERTPTRDALIQNTEKQS